jgi:nitronate monooxygenase
MKRVDDFRLQLGSHELVPIMIGGMGVDISTADLALEVARLGGVGPYFGRDGQYGDGSPVQHQVRQGQAQAVQIQRCQLQQVRSRPVRPRTTGRSDRSARWPHHGEPNAASGMILVNCMEKLTMNAPKRNLARSPRSAAGCRH